MIKKESDNKLLLHKQLKTYDIIFWDFDGVIILTDMEAPAPKACKAQRMWMTDERGASRPYFQTRERVIAIS